MTQKVKRCAECFVNVLDELEHICVAHTIGAVRTSVYVEELWPLFKFKMAGELHLLNSRMGRFDLVNDNIILLSTSTDGMLKFKRADGWIDASYEAAIFKRFSIVFATWIHNQWELLFRVDVANGVQFVKIHGVLNEVEGVQCFPNELKLNTIAIFGMKPTSLGMNFTVYANGPGETGGYNTSNLIGSEDDVKVCFVLLLLELNRANFQ